MRILIIEDEFNLADAIASRLKKEKYQVDICTDGEEGLRTSLLVLSMGLTIMLQNHFI